MKNKAEQRAYYRLVRAKLAAEKKLQYDQAISNKLMHLIDQKALVAIYAALPNEIDLKELSIKNLLLPKMQADKTLKFYAASEKLKLNEIDGIFGPIGVTELTPEVIICPMLAFDLAKNRWGSGGGFYDRSFKIYPNALKIGVAYAASQADLVVTDCNDVSLDYIVTEQQVIS